MDEKTLVKVLTLLGPVVKHVGVLYNLLNPTRRRQEMKRGAVKVLRFVLLVLTLVHLILTLWGVIQVLMGRPVMGVEHCTVGNGCVQQVPFTGPDSPLAGAEHCTVGNGCVQQVPLTEPDSPLASAEHCTVGNGCVQRNG